jgi:hypothetical protein
MLPGFLDALTLRQLRLPQGQIDIGLAKAGDQAAAHVIARKGQVSALVRT